MLKTTAFCCVASLCIAPCCGAAEIYRSVDAQGRVSYSATPPRDAAASETVNLPPAPSVEQVEAARQRAAAIGAAAEQQSAQRQQWRQAKNQRLQEAEQRVQKARTNLEQLRVPQDADWIKNPGGGRRLSADYHQRLQTAEQSARDAEDTLSRTRRDAQ